MEIVKKISEEERAALKKKFGGRIFFKCGNLVGHYHNGGKRILVEKFIFPGEAGERAVYYETVSFHKESGLLLASCDEELLCFIDPKTCLATPYFDEFELTEFSTFKLKDHHRGFSFFDPEGQKQTDFFFPDGEIKRHSRSKISFYEDGEKVILCRRTASLA